ncbi:hypothetical protein AS189_11800 [Arthrobacter alpinus]|uniref:Uncharacterized protein n=1 Tax=Arthrobacter alpinus TaxID=656366 RepID=A0A0S2M089_9MICC|nr:hypothetical protein AS189_11800 [Arthrobacter alpinus]
MSVRTGIRDRASNHRPADWWIGMAERASPTTTGKVSISGHTGPYSGQGVWRKMVETDGGAHVRLRTTDEPTFKGFAVKPR